MTFKDCFGEKKLNQDRSRFYLIVFKWKNSPSITHLFGVTLDAQSHRASKKN